eukprot:CAMPEP_0116119402 /NCGR_PEP_ID=MMETSP0329-20121206/2618_1 /TAXON_ID=697910 /ORGANISM="Pseudo-nitzschia arenysensis, Strain B593" /LENGTH=204 /DNA_ID=CAMNT_0003613093 /DNA_START=10 /DNA_END=624 /DNA_ORIENTATION=+
MMQEHNDEETPVSTPAGVDNDLSEKVIDSVCDPFGLVPDNLEEAFAHKKRMQIEEAKKELLKAEADALAGTTYVEPSESEDDKGTGYFHLDCCGKTPPATEEIKDEEFPAEKLPTDEGENAGEIGETISVGNGSQQLADIAAKMDEIDLETAAEDASTDQMSDTASLQKRSVEWYKEPLYASLIVLSGLFTIAIVVMAVLLITN